jgi:hypothetical protein
MMLLFGAAALADTLTLTGTSGEVFNGEAVGPYGVTVNGTLQQMVCDDLYIRIGLGYSWDATRLGWENLTEQERRDLYGPAYWLTTSVLTDTGLHADEQWALWHLFSPQSELPGDSAASLTWALGQYAANPDYAGYASLLVYRPNPRTSSQEFLATQESFANAATDTPESGTLLLVLLGSGTIWMGRRRAAPIQS